MSVQEKYLVIGASGQIGSALVRRMVREYGAGRVIASDLAASREGEAEYVRLDATDAEALSGLIRSYRITRIFHLAAILSANGEADPMRTWRINMQSYCNVLEAARSCDVRQVFFPSSIAVFGAHVPHDNTGQWTCLVPATVYGISKVAGENWSEYYHKKFGMDIRSLRYPGIISHESAPGGGTTDYAVEVYRRAAAGQPYVCYLAPDATLPMIYMEDAIRATLELMEAPARRISVRTSYNLSGMSFSPAELEWSVRKRCPHFSMEYQPDFRQQIAASWPRSIDDRCAREDWNWQPAYTLDTMTEDMISHLSADRLYAGAPDQ